MGSKPKSEWVKVASLADMDRALALGRSPTPVSRIEAVVEAIAPLIAADALKQSPPPVDVAALYGYEAGYAEGRREALEEAAKVVEGRPITVNGEIWDRFIEWPALRPYRTGNSASDSDEVIFSQQLSRAIRALTVKEVGNDA